MSLALQQGLSLIPAPDQVSLALQQGLSLITSSIRRFPPQCLDHNNLIQSILTKIEANVAGGDD